MSKISDEEFIKRGEKFVEGIVQQILAKDANAEIDFNALYGRWEEFARWCDIEYED